MYGSGKEVLSFFFFFLFFFLACFVVCMYFFVGGGGGLLAFSISMSVCLSWVYYFSLTKNSM